MRTYFLFALAMTVLISCSDTDQASKDSTSRDSITDTDSVSVESDTNLLTENVIATLNNSGFSSFAKEKSPESEWNSFKMVRFYNLGNNTATERFSPDKNYYESYGSFLKYAPDSSKFVDLDSYNIDIRKNKQGNFIGNEQGPDIEVSLVDLNKKEKKRLLFLGPGNSVEDATWIDNDNLLLIGTATDSSATGTVPTVWKFNVPEESFTVYETNDPEVAKSLKGYRRNVRLKSVTIR